MAQDIEQDEKGFYGLCVWNAEDKTDEEVCMNVDTQLNSCTLL